MWVVRIYWSNRSDLCNLGPAALYAFKHSPKQKKIGEPLAQGDVLIANTRNAQMVDEFRALVRNDDVRIEKVRMNGFIGTPLLAKVAKPTAWSMSCTS